MGGGGRNGRGGCKTVKIQPFQTLYNYSGKKRRKRIV
jgi:hypothetical protein